MLEEIILESIGEFNKILNHLSSLGRTASVEEMEAACRVGMRRITSHLMEVLIKESGRGYRGTSIACSCGREARFVGYRKKRVQTLFGEITFERAYYHCASCGEGIHPLDEALGVSRKEMSRVLERGICRLAAVESFETAAEDIWELTGASISAKTVQTASEAEGETILVRMQDKARGAVAGEVEIEAEEHPGVLVVGMDGKMVPTLSGYKEMKVAALYDLLPGAKQGGRDEPSVGRTTYIGQITEPDAFGESVWLESLSRGSQNAKEIVVIGDGAHWIWNQAEMHWPEALQILDFWHVKDHLWELGSALWGEGTKKTRKFVGYKLDQIKKGKVGMVIRALTKLKVTGDEKAEILRQTIGYLRTNRHRMNYPKYAKKGYHIGSGVVESACKQFGTRLDGAGMRWSERGASAIAALRALKLSGRWDAYWQPVRQPLLA